MIVELIYEKTCPNIVAARTRLMQAFHQARIQPSWREWETGEPDTPEYARPYGSPTILVNGKDVSGHEQQASGETCRLYASSSGYEPVPAIEEIVIALLGPEKSGKQPALGMAALPSVGIAFLPKLTCPVCWPAYTALLSSAGIGFIDYTPYLPPLMTIFLGVTLAALAYRAQIRHGYGPFWLGMAGSVSVVVGKFIMESEFALYFGVVLLVGASLWNIWPRKARPLSPPISTK